MCSNGIPLEISPIVGWIEEYPIILYAEVIIYQNSLSYEDLKMNLG